MAQFTSKSKESLASGMSEPSSPTHIMKAWSLNVPQHCSLHGDLILSIIKRGEGASGSKLSSSRPAYLSMWCSNWAVVATCQPPSWKGLNSTWSSELSLPPNPHPHMPGNKAMRAFLSQQNSTHILHSHPSSDRELANAALSFDNFIHILSLTMFQA